MSPEEVIDKLWNCIQRISSGSTVYGQSYCCGSHRGDIHKDKCKFIEAKEVMEAYLNQ